jgi:hypothetical protein
MKSNLSVRITNIAALKVETCCFIGAVIYRQSVTRADGDEILLQPY